MKRMLSAIFVFTFTTGIALADFVAFDKSNFEAAVQSKATVVLHAHEWWCTTCRAQANVLEGLQKEPKFSKVTMFRASPGGDRETLQPMNVTSRAIVVVFANGKEIGRLVWNSDAAQIRKLVEQAIVQTQR